MCLYLLILKMRIVSVSVIRARFCCSAIGAYQPTQAQAACPLPASWGLHATSPPSEAQGISWQGTCDMQHKGSSHILSDMPHHPPEGGTYRSALCWGGGEQAYLVTTVFSLLASLGGCQDRERELYRMHFVKHQVL